MIGPHGHRMSWSPSHRAARKVHTLIHTHDWPTVAHTDRTSFYKMHSHSNHPCKCQKHTSTHCSLSNTHSHPLTLSRHTHNTHTRTHTSHFTSDSQFVCTLALLRSLKTFWCPDHSPQHLNLDLWSWDPGICDLKSYPSSSNVQPRLRTTALHHAPWLKNQEARGSQLF